MAMRPRSGRPNPSRPPRLIVGRTYEQFKPMSEWRQEDDHDTLLLYLPGFQKEYIKVTTEDVNTVRVRGERLVADNKWSRFLENFQVPENCDMTGIRARFDGGILTITMPRKITATATAIPTATAAAPRVAPKAGEQPFRRTQQDEALQKPKEESKQKETAFESAKKPDRPRVAPKAEEQPFRKTKQEEALQKPKEESKQKETSLQSEKKQDMPQSPLKGSTLPPQPIPPSSSKPSKKEPFKTAPEVREKNEELVFGSLPTSIPKKEKHNVVEKPDEEREIHQKGGYGKMDFDDGKEKENPLEEEMKRVSDGRMGKSKDTGVSHGGFLGDKVEEMKRVVARREVSEDRKLLVNVGVGVLVIVALGVHVSYAIGLIGRGK
ncbi:hypothetical protein Lser_V15G03307 [Lactuca serriola]